MEEFLGPKSRAKIKKHLRGYLVTIDNKIIYQTNELTNIKRKIIDLKKRKNALNFGKVDEICDQALQNTIILKQQDKRILDGRVSRAISNKGLESVINLTHEETNVYITKVSFQFYREPWCDSWFINLLKQTSLSRNELYKRLSTLKNLEKDEFDKELGMLWLSIV